jgi:hypothetical protein
MRSVFQRIAKKLNLKFTFVEALDAVAPETLTVPSIVFSRHSVFQKNRWLLKQPECRIFHLIRDPRDVVISATHYHCTAAEKWLHEPKKSFNGLTYHEIINLHPDDQARYVFEMRHVAGRSIMGMRNWNYKRTNSFECRYEDLIADPEMIRFTEALTHLGFESHELETCRSIFEKNSLFGSKKKIGHAHIRSGESRQWRAAFNLGLASEFNTLFGDVLVKLGYEPDDRWMDASEFRSESAQGISIA